MNMLVLAYILTCKRSTCQAVIYYFIAEFMICFRSIDTQFSDRLIYIFSKNIECKWKIAARKANEIHLNFKIAYQTFIPVFCVACIFINVFFLFSLWNVRRTDSQYVKIEIRSNIFLWITQYQNYTERIFHERKSYLGVISMHWVT